MRKDYIIFVLITMVLFIFSCSDEGENAVYGCMDENACNYSISANINDDCVYAISTFCDCSDIPIDNYCDCYGTLPISECGCEDIPIGECDCNGTMFDCANECNGTAELDECGVCDDDYYFTYNDYIYDIFDTKGCFECHNEPNDNNKHLQLSTYQGILNGSDNGPIINECNDASTSTLLTTLQDGGAMCEDNGFCFEELNFIFTCWNYMIGEPLVPTFNDEGPCILDYIETWISQGAPEGDTE